MSDSKTSGAVHLTTSTFDQAVSDAGEMPVFIDFFAEWCGPCKVAGPVVDKLADEYQSKAVVAKVNVDEEPDLARRFGVMSIPTIVVLKRDGDQMKIVEQMAGFPGEDRYKQIIEAAL